MVNTPLRDWDQVQIDLAITEASLAVLSIDHLHRERDKESLRTIRNARRVYDSVLARRKEMRLNLRQATALESQLERLRKRLRWLGEDL